MKKLLLGQSQFALKLITHPELDRYLDAADKDYFLRLANKSNARLEFATNHLFHLNEFGFHSSLNGQKLDS